MDDGPNNFSDPQLKAALQRLQGGHTADDELRQRVLGALESSAAKSDVRPPRKIGRAIGWALAACLVLGVSAGFYVHHANEKAEHERYLADNLGLFNEMVATQGKPAAGPLVLQVASQGSIADLKAQIAKEVGREIPSPDLSQAGWTLAEASVIPFRNKKAGRFDYRNGDRHVMLISLPATLLYGAEEDEDYAYTVEGHPIAGYVSKGGLHCVIGGAGESLNDMVALRDRLHGL